MDLQWRKVKTEEGRLFLVDDSKPFGSRTMGQIIRAKDWGADEYHLIASFTYRVNCTVKPKRFEVTDGEEAKAWLEVITRMHMP